MKREYKLEPNGAPLGQFIIDNQALLSALGVFLALLVFSNDISSTVARGVLSFVLFGAVVLICFEIREKFPIEMGLRLFLFRYVLLWGTASIIFGWLMEFRVAWDFLLFFPVTFIVLYVLLDTFVPIIRSIKFTRWIFGIDREKKTLLQKIVRGAVIIGVTLFSLLSGIYLSFGANVLLDLVKRLGG